MNDFRKMGIKDRVVTVDRETLEKTLIENREKHQKEYQLAVAGYRKLAQERLEKLKAKAVAAVEDNFKLVASRIERFNPEDEDDRLDDHITLVNEMYFNLRVPKDHTPAYNVAIELAKWEVNKTVELTVSEFQSFVLDQWDWMDDFQKLSKSYTAAL